MAHRVLITAIGGNVGQGVLKALRAAGRNFYVVAIDMEPLSAGFFMADSYYQISKTGDPSFISELKSIAKKERIEAIYVCSPTELEFFSINKESLEKELNISVFVNPTDVVLTGTDKMRTVDFLRNNNLPYPQTAHATDERGVNEIIEKYNFPLIVKPRRGFTSKNVFLVNSMEEIMAALTLVPDMIVQRYLPDSESEYTATVISGDNRKVLASIVLHRKLNQGTTYRTEMVEEENITNQVINIANALGIIGVCNLQFRLMNERVFIFEINPRFSGTAGIRYLYGFNDPEMVFELFRLGIDVQQPKLQHAVVLRYWNEIFIPRATFYALREDNKKYYGVQTINVKTSTATAKAQNNNKNYLDEMSDKYFTEKALGPDRIQMGFIMDAVLPYCTGPKVLELGLGSGHWSQKLIDKGFDVTVVEGSAVLAEHCRLKFGKSVQVINSLFEEYNPVATYHTIIASCVLEHVDNYKLFLNLLKSWLHENGNLHIVVPNALSLHRRIGVKMGMLDHLMQLSPQELEVGHCRTYNKDIFKAQIEESGLKVDFISGIYVKPLSSGQMIEWDEKILKAYNELSNELPEYTAFLYANCSK